MGKESNKKIAKLKGNCSTWQGRLCGCCHKEKSMCCYTCCTETLDTTVLDFLGAGGTLNDLSNWTEARNLPSSILVYIHHCFSLIYNNGKEANLTPRMPESQTVKQKNQSFGRKYAFP